MFDCPVYEIGGSTKDLGPCLSVPASDHLLMMPAPVEGVESIRLLGKPVIHWPMYSVTGDAFKLAAPSWERSATLCPAVKGQGAQGFESCVYTDGEAECPNGYPERHLLHDYAVDGRTIEGQNNCIPSGLIDAAGASYTIEFYSGWMAFPARTR